MKRLVCLGLFLLFVSACGDDTTAPEKQYDLSAVPPPDMSGDDSELGKNDLAANDLANFPFDLTSVAGAPVVTLVSPMSTTDVVGNTLTVRVSVTSPSSDPISAVTLALPPASGMIMPMNMAPVGPGLFEGSVNISAIGPHGQFSVAATDDKSRTGYLEAEYRHDVGPVITFIQPTATTAHVSLPLSFTVSDALYSVDPAQVSAKLRAMGDVTLTATPATATTPLFMSGMIAFNTFNPPLDGLQRITVNATNSHGTPATAYKDFTVDNTGPTISITTPLPGDLAGGVINISAVIDDVSNVDDNTVSAVFTGSASFQTPLYRMNAMSDVFTGTFDARQLGVDFVFPTLSVRADDLLGNHAELAEEIVIDNTAPIISMDPPNVRVAHVVDGARVCSISFDPLGAYTANDGDTVPQIVSLMARAEDEGNSAPGSIVEWFAGINASTVRLVAIPAPTGNEILAVDTDSDGICDDVNPLLLPTTGLVAGSNQSVQVALTKVIAQGSPDYETSPGPIPGGCDALGDPMVKVPPPPLCPGIVPQYTTLTYALGYQGGAEPALWTIPPAGSGAFDCIGYQFDTLNRLPEGPACFVVAAIDKVGNHAVSAPLRLCINRGTVGVCPSFNTTNAPKCTGTYDQATKLASSTTRCTPRTFPAPLLGEVVELNQ